MGKVIFRLPSKGTQYGYAEYSFEGDFSAEDGSGGYDLGVQYKHFVDNFQRGEAAGQAAQRAVKPKVVAAKDPRKDTLDEQFGSNFREPTEAEAVALITEELGASVYDEPVEEEAAPWEAPPPAPSDDDWDF